MFRRVLLLVAVLGVVVLEVDVVKEDCPDDNVRDKEADEGANALVANGEPMPSMEIARAENFIMKAVDRRYRESRL